MRRQFLKIYTVGVLFYQVATQPFYYKYLGIALELQSR